MAVTSAMAEACLLLQRGWRSAVARRHARTLESLRSMLTCIVCHEEGASLTRCSNGHGCCMSCTSHMTDARCPMCRERRNAAPDRTLRILGNASGIRLLCGACSTRQPFAEFDRHRAWCPEHRFLCPAVSCNACVPSSGMAAHVLSHDGVHELSPDDDGDYHAIVAATHGNNPHILCIGGTAVVVSYTPMARRTPIHVALDLSTNLHPMIHMHARAFYPSGRSAALNLTVTQYALADIDVGDWKSVHRCGVVAPALASREVLEVPMPILIPESRAPNDASLPTLIDSAPGLHWTADIFREAGVKDDRSYDRPEDGSTTRLALLHLVFRPDAFRPIQSLFAM